MRENIERLIKRYKGKIEWLEEHTRHMRDRRVDDCIATWKGIIIDLEDLLDKQNTLEICHGNVNVFVL